jgi:hypothetical protein
VVRVAKGDRFGCVGVDTLYEDLGADAGPRLFVFGAIPRVRRELLPPKRQALEDPGATLCRADLESGRKLSVFDNHRSRTATQDE